MEQKLTMKEFLDKKIICSKYIAKVSGLSYNMFSYLKSQKRDAPEYYINELNKALKEIANQLNNITIVHDRERTEPGIPD